MKDSYKKECKDYLILTLIFWIPMTSYLTLSVYYHIMWTYFGDNSGITNTYTTIFDSSLDMYLYLWSIIGGVGKVLLFLLGTCYLWITRAVYIGLRY